MSPVLAHWSAVWPVLVIYLAVAGAHLAGTLRGGLGGPGGRRAVISEAALFQGGLLLARLAIVSPLRYWSGIYIWVRAIQDLALAIVAPGLIVVGAPWPALARSVGRRQIGQRAPDGPAAGPRRPWWLRWPLATVVAFNVIWLGWHLPALFDKVPASAEQQRLKALSRRLQRLSKLAADQKNQRHLVDEPRVLRTFDAVLQVAKQQMREVEAEIATLLASDPLWQKLEEALRSIKGVAGRTVARVLADLPEIGTLSNKAVSKLAGVAPLAQDSGKREGKRAVRGGRRNVRAILYVVAGVVRRYNPDFAAFAERMAAKGKPKRVIRVALAHKLLVRLNARAREARAAIQLCRAGRAKCLTK